MTIIGGLTWRLRLVTFVHVLFSPPILLILAFQPILFHTIVTEGHCMLFFIEEFFFKVEQSCLTVVCQMTCQRSQICWCASCWHHVFVLLVQSALIHFKILILPSLARDWHCLSFKKTTVHINLLEYFCFLEMDVCVYPSLCWLCSLSRVFVMGHSGTTWFKAHAKSPLTISCVLYAAME